MQLSKIIIALLLLVGCKPNLAVFGSLIPKGSNSAPASVYAMNKLEAAPGDVINIAGVNFSEGMLVQVGGSLVALRIENQSSASFIMPDTGASKEVGATFFGSNNEILSTFALVSRGSDVHVPVMDADPALLCSDITYQDPNGRLKIGARNCSSGAALCQTEGEVGCVTTGNYRAANISSLSYKVVRGQDVAGVQGQALPRPENCAADGELSCVTTSAFPALKKDLLTPAVIKNGVIVNGVTGQYPSSLYPLSGADGTVDLTDINFSSQIKSSLPFEFFDSRGSRFVGTGDSNLDPENIKAGLEIFNVTGTFAEPCNSDGLDSCLTTARFKSVDTDAFDEWDVRLGKTLGAKSGRIVFYKNMSNLSRYNRTTGDGASSSTTVPDFYDSIDDYNNNQASIPSQGPTPWTPAPSQNWLREAQSDTGTGTGGIAGNKLCDGNEDCIYQDQMTKIYWAKVLGAASDWEGVVNYCENLSYGGHSDWRVPTAKELSTAIVNGIWSLKTALALRTGNFWSATAQSDYDVNAYVTSLRFGDVNRYNRTSVENPICIR